MDRTRGHRTTLTKGLMAGQAGHRRDILSVKSSLTGGLNSTCGWL